MAEEGDSSQEKTEEPSARRLEKAREEGQVPRSKELNTTAVLVAGALSLLMFGRFFFDGMQKIGQYNLDLDRETIFDPKLMIAHLGMSVGDALLIISPFLVIVLIASILGPIGLGGWNFSTKALLPKLNRMSVIKGFGRMFGQQALIELLKSWAKVIVVAVSGYLALSLIKDDLFNLIKMEPATAIPFAVSLFLWAVLIICCSTLFIAIVDMPIQVYQHTKKLRMSMQEVKDEYKETEGKPEVKARIRRLQQEISQRKMMSEVPDADVVITNPTHYSVALKYDAMSGDAPMLLAKGLDQTALKIREIAEEHDVPLVEAPPLARALYAHTKIGEQIPEGLYLAVAQVLAYVIQLDQYFKGKGPKPDRVPEMPIPEELKVAPE